MQYGQPKDFARDQPPKPPPPHHRQQRPNHSRAFRGGYQFERHRYQSQRQSQMHDSNLYDRTKKQSTANRGPVRVRLMNAREEELDPSLHEALNSDKHDALLKLEITTQQFLEDPKLFRLAFPDCLNNYFRMLLHHVGDFYNLDHPIDTHQTGKKAITFYKKREFRSHEPYPRPSFSLRDVRVDYIGPMASNPLPNVQFRDTESRQTGGLSRQLYLPDARMYEDYQRRNRHPSDGFDSHTASFDLSSMRFANGNGGVSDNVVAEEEVRRPRSILLNKDRDKLASKAAETQEREAPSQTHEERLETYNLLKDKIFGDGNPGEREGEISSGGSSDAEQQSHLLLEFAQKMRNQQNGEESEDVDAGRPRVDNPADYHRDKMHFRPKTGPNMKYNKRTSDALVHHTIAQKSFQPPTQQPHQHSHVSATFFDHQAHSHHGPQPFAHQTQVPPPHPHVTLNGGIPFGMPVPQQSHGFVMGGQGQAHTRQPPGHSHQPHPPTTQPMSVAPPMVAPPGPMPPMHLPHMQSSVMPNSVTMPSSAMQQMPVHSQTSLVYYQPPSASLGQLAPGISPAHAMGTTPSMSASVPWHTPPRNTFGVPGTMPAPTTSTGRAANPIQAIQPNTTDSLVSMTMASSSSSSLTPVAVSAATATASLSVTSGHITNHHATTTATPSTRLPLPTTQLDHVTASLPSSNRSPNVERFDGQTREESGSTSFNGNHERQLPISTESTAVSAPPRRRPLVMGRERRAATETESDDSSSRGSVDPTKQTFSDVKSAAARSVSYGSTPSVRKNGPTRPPLIIKRTTEPPIDLTAISKPAISARISEESSDKADLDSAETADNSSSDLGGVKKRRRRKKGKMRQ